MSLSSAFPVTGETLLRFESGLRRQRSELTRAIGRAHEEIRALADCGPGDVIDDSWGSSSKEVMFASYSMSRTQLRRVDAALERIATGEFGICAVCGDPIGLKRLQALPWAKRCIECQEECEQDRIQ